MNTLEQLVPPLELCLKIPRKTFRDTCFAWVPRFRGKGSFREVAYYELLFRPRINDSQCVPAPTLAEILEALENHGSVFTRRDDDGWMVMLETAGDEEGYGYDAKIERDTANPATAALKLWMEVNQ